MDKIIAILTGLDFKHHDYIKRNTTKVICVGER